MQDDQRKSGLILQFKKKLKFYVAGVLDTKEKTLNWIVMKNSALYEVL